MTSNFGRIWELYRKSSSTLYKIIFSPGVYAYSKRSYSQEGEDMILARLFEHQKTGFYVDVGAHHPQRLSNTYYFYLQGWQGINIDAMPSSMTLFKSLRPRDTNLELAVSDSKEELIYYAFQEPALNSFCKDLVQEYITLGNQVVFTKKIETCTLAEVFQYNLPSEQTIDFMNIDVEGLDYQVLKSNNWEQYRPRFLLVEALSLLNIQSGEYITGLQFLKEQNYELFCKTANTLIFKDSNVQVSFQGFPEL